MSPHSIEKWFALNSELLLLNFRTLTTPLSLTVEMKRKRTKVLEVPCGPQREIEKVSKGEERIYRIKLIPKSNFVGVSNRLSEQSEYLVLLIFCGLPCSCSGFFLRFT